jgi:hypothetical protein
MARPTEKDTIILTATIGSHSYGTATATSDMDLMSIVIPSADYYFGFQEWGVSGTKDLVSDNIEHRLYEIRKAIQMLSHFNPNIIPLLWLDPMHYEVMTPQGALLVKNRELFNSKKVYSTFSGYAHGQLQKMGGVFNDNEEPNKLLKTGHQRFQLWADEEIAFQRALRDIKDGKQPQGQAPNVTKLVSEGHKYDEGYLNALIALRTHSKEECKRIKDGPITGRMGKKRKELREQYGYDTKFAFNTIRLMRMCVEFLNNPEQGLKVYRKGIDAEFLYSIRTGAFSQEEIKAMADELFEQAKDSLKGSSLPDEPNREAIHNLTMDLIRTTL